MIINNLIRFTYRTKANRVQNIPLTISQLTDYKTNTFCSFDRTKNERVFLIYMTDSQILNKVIVRWCSVSKPLKNSISSQLSRILGTSGKPFTEQVYFE